MARLRNEVQQRAMSWQFEIVLRKALPRPRSILGSAPDQKLLKYVTCQLQNRSSIKGYIILSRLETMSNHISRLSERSTC